jgi:hypothetical protein
VTKRPLGGRAGANPQVESRGDGAGEQGGAATDPSAVGDPSKAEGNRGPFMPWKERKAGEAGRSRAATDPSVSRNCDQRMAALPCILLTRISKRIGTCSRVQKAVDLCAKDACLPKQVASQDATVGQSRATTADLSATFVIEGWGRSRWKQEEWVPTTTDESCSRVQWADGSSATTDGSVSGDRD